VRLVAALPAIEGSTLPKALQKVKQLLFLKYQHSCWLPQQLEHCVHVGLDVDGLETIGHGPRRLQAVAGDEEDDALVLPDLPGGHRLAERAEGHARCGLPEHSRRLGEQRHALADRLQPVRIAANADALLDRLAAA